MAASKENVFRFVPVRVEGIDGVEEFAVWPDRIELRIGGDWRPFFFGEMDRQRIEMRRWWRRMFPFLEGGCIGERDFCREPGEQYFRWFSDPEITVFTPSDQGDDYGETHFCKIHRVMHQGPYYTCDLA